MLNQPRSRPLYATLAILTTAIGYTCRFAHLHLPYFVIKYGGSACWAAMIYWLLALASPRSSIRNRAIATTLIATAIEFLKLLRNPALDAFRFTFPGKVILGRFFSPRDLVAYYLAIAACVLLDHYLRQNDLRANKVVA